MKRERGVPPDAAPTRDRLLDAVERLASEGGADALSHRGIARQAGVHASLLHYHYGTVEQAVEEAVARRAARLRRLQADAIRALHARGAWSVEDVVAALWRPFAALGGTIDAGWRNYLCLVARVASADDALAERHFGDVERQALRALRTVLPGATDEALAFGLRITKMLFEREVVARCRRMLDAGVRAERDRRLEAFAAAGLRALAPMLAPQRTMPAATRGTSA